MNREELAWAAGFWDGEGNCYTPITSNKYLTLRMQIAQNEIEPLNKFHKTVKVGTIRGPYNRHHRWCATGYADCIVVVSLLWPFLCEPKREQIHECFLDWQMYQYRKRLA